MEKRTIREIARDIERNWSKPYFGAVPYIKAMYALDDADSVYGCDRAHDIVLYFLCNAGSWRGKNARAIKAELKAIIK